ncbi:MAG: hypothetical protein ACJ764_03575, partial [Solirubrobacteraceae bacterium]
MVALAATPSALAAGSAAHQGAQEGTRSTMSGSAGKASKANPVVITTITTSSESGAAVAANTAVLVTSPHKPPKGYRLTAARVKRIAVADPKVRSELRSYPKAKAYEYTKGAGNWQVSWFSSGHTSKEIIQVYIDDATGKVTQVWTGFQVPWTMARGYPGAFGRRVNALYVWIPMCLLFMAPFLPWPRRRDGRWVRVRGGWSLLHMDLLVLLGFSISLALFDHAQIGLSVPLVYPFLLYLMVRLLLLAFGRGRPRRPLALRVPVAWVAIATVFLVGFRIGLNVTDSNVIDVGYAGVIGAHRIMHDRPLYGDWPSDNGNGDTYGPVNYYAYVPAVAAFGWSGSWDDLPAAHAASVAFDILTLLGLMFLGRRIRGPTLGTVLGFLWAAYPFSLWALASDTNDTLVGLLILAALLVITSAPARGAMAAAAGLTKFAPLALGPLFMRGVGPRWPRPRSLVLYVLSFGLVLGLAMLPVFLDHNLHAFWKDTFDYQAHRITPFSVWGLWGGLSIEQHVLEGAVAALAIAVAFVPRRRGVVEVAALAAALIIALQLVANYWLYSYIVWFFPAAIVGLFGFYPSRVASRDDDRTPVDVTRVAVA